MPPALRIESLWKCYIAGVRGCSAQVWALRGLSLTVQAGERAAIVGAPGAGKTTLAHCILGLRAPTAGKIEIAGAVEVIELQEVRMSGGQDDGSRPPDLLTSIVLTRDPDLLLGWFDRILLLRDGRLHPLTFQSARRVAERSAALR
jgi:energy-coupling factor transporter ATP-binding protein EcfA2